MNNVTSVYFASTRLGFYELGKGVYETPLDTYDARIILIESIALDKL